jgi:hypothetical protein
VPRRGAGAASLAPQRLATNGVTLASHGFMATSTNLLAAHLIEPGSTTAVSYVVETQGSHADIWIYSVGDRSATLHLPPGFNGAVTWTPASGSATYTSVANNQLTIPLASSGSTPTLRQGSLTHLTGTLMVVR